MIDFESLMTSGNNQFGPAYQTPLLTLNLSVVLGNPRISIFELIGERSRQTENVEGADERDAIASTPPVKSTPTACPRPELQRTPFS
jgi:hypothetical protein